MRDQPLVTKGRNQWAKRLKMSSAVKTAVKKMSNWEMRWIRREDTAGMVQYYVWPCKHCQVLDIR
jgi:hypothetical protein